MAWVGTELPGSIVSARSLTSCSLSTIASAASS